jgi:hypothetical protein
MVSLKEAAVVDKVLLKNSLLLSARLPDGGEKKGSIPCNSVRLFS